MEEGWSDLGRCRTILLCIEISVTSSEAHGLGDPQPQGVLLWDTAVPWGRATEPTVPAKRLNPTVGKSGREHTSKGCVIIF